MRKSLTIFQDDPADAMLDEIQVAAPCPAEWADMVGSDKVRFCAACQKNVYNLSGMRRSEALELLRASEGRLCVRFFRRADGTILTEDCPIGIALLLRRARRATLAAAAVSLGAAAALLATLGGFFGGGLTRKTCNRAEDLTQGVEELSPGSPHQNGSSDLPQSTLGLLAPEPPPSSTGPGAASTPGQPTMGRPAPQLPPRLRRGSPKAPPVVVQGGLGMGSRGMRKPSIGHPRSK